MDSEVAHELGALKARCDAADGRWEDVKQYMIRSSTILKEIGQTMAVVASNQADFKAYTSKCDMDRINFDKRITAAENFQGCQVRAALVGGGIMGFLVEGGSKFVAKAMEWFS